MLYFTFNNISQKNSLLVQENIEVSDVLDAFNNKLKMELGIGFNIINGINDLIGIPEVSFVINNDNAKKSKTSYTIPWLHERKSP